MGGLYEVTALGPPPKTAAVHLLYHKTVGLAVSGDVKLTRLETDIVDTADFQRLRWIQQLGSCSWVYPTAVHTRFDHSLGVLKMADRMVTAINEGMEQVDTKAGQIRYRVTDQQRILARLCGLLHDITHVPYGHTLENELKIFGSHDDIAANAATDGRDRLEILVGKDSQIGTAIQTRLGEPMYKRLMDILYRGKKDRLEVFDEDGQTCDEFIYHLVSDTVCADLLDYIERDSFFCNLGISIHKRFLDYLYVSDVQLEESDKEDRRRVIVRLWKSRNRTPRYDVMTDLAGVLDARYKLTERVYFHHTKITTAAMIGRAAQEAKYIDELSSVKMLQFGDATFLDYLANLDKRMLPEKRKKHLKSVKIVMKLASAVRDRVLYKRTKSYPKGLFTGSPDESCYADLIHWFSRAERRRDFENMLATLAGVEEGDVLIYVASPSMNRKIARAVVDYENQRTLLGDVPEVTLKERITNIGDSHFRLWKADILVHPRLDEKTCRLIQWAFEAHFFPAERAESALLLLLNAVAADDEAIAAPGAPRVLDACTSAAADLMAGDRLFGHKANMLDLLREKLREKLGGATE
jgi:HD superfamily phosphohydrolase